MKIRTGKRFVMLVIGLIRSIARMILSGIYSNGWRLLKQLAPGLMDKLAIATTRENEPQASRTIMALKNSET
ncbi:hypothetical protein RMS29_027815 (plasmid) [Agrobacterium rosae]|uniref:Uncharacterized protein n=2 Tax=Agrobacterium rosae TaxID=1972867 RepID=A0AAW9FNS4_9HYPH|nr:MULTISPECIES: hypothetical protein [Agrobacterium]MDX8305227.1 hypothetical protein [Agrobacterium rosae]MDX8311508.1 hypothetical protein [Agrobacterium sp. rho-13.3]MDX8316258.1 hypothetical protein [Agrobacterium rosae]MDX8332435.1 hypothetical protein [Agrobacterium rosae]